MIFRADVYVASRLKVYVTTVVSLSFSGNKNRFPKTSFWRTEVANLKQNKKWKTQYGYQTEDMLKIFNLDIF